MGHLFEQSVTQSWYKTADFMRGHIAVTNATKWFKGQHLTLENQVGKDEIF